MSGRTKLGLMGVLAVGLIAGSLLTIDGNGQEVGRFDRIIASTSVDVQNPALTDVARITGTANGMILSRQGGTAGIEVTNTGAAVNGDLSTSTTIAVAPTTVTLSAGENHNVNASGAGQIRVNTQNQAVIVTGLQGGTSGRFACLMNVAGSSLTLSGENAGSTAANRFATSSAAVGFGGSVCVMYDSALQRWFVHQ